MSNASNLVIFMLSNDHTDSLNQLIASRNFWWVNQNQTYINEVHGGFLWSPKTRADGGRNQFYINMTIVRPGDIVFSFCNQMIKAIGVIKKSAISAVKPMFDNPDIKWANDGWYVETEFREINQEIYPKKYVELLRPHLPSKYSPLQENGRGLQSVYLAYISPDMARVLLELIGDEGTKIIEIIDGIEDSNKSQDEGIVEIILQRTDIGPTTINQLIQARRGQGVFKANLRLVETKCRVTGVSDIQHLRASHIKPWKDSSDFEKLSGHNGLLLSPHIDHLFDRGFISFSPAGDLLASSKLASGVLSTWGVNGKMNVGGFSEAQHGYLEHHRRLVFKG